jgi:hypothetical protein
MNRLDVLKFSVEVGEHLFLRDLVLGVKVKQLEQQRQSLLQVQNIFFKFFFYFPSNCHWFLNEWNNKLIL